MVAGETSPYPKADPLADTGFRPVHHFDEARRAWPRGRQPDLFRQGAAAFRADFKGSGPVEGAKTFDLVTSAYPAGFAFHHAARHINPFLSICSRLMLVRFRDFNGISRLMAVEPTIPEGSQQIPFYAQQIERFGERLSNFLFKVEIHTLPEALRAAGVRAEDVDYIVFDHLHAQEIRRLLGTVDGQFDPVFPNARLIVQQKELDTLHSVHPMQSAWYVPQGGDGVDAARLLAVEGDLQLGAGVALITSPGHTDGNFSVVLDTADGVWVCSENGMTVDNWFPEHSRIPGLRHYARFWGREVVPNANTLEDSLDQYNSMVMEKALADPNKADPRFTQVLPSTEILPWLRNWPCLPTLFTGGIAYGSLVPVPVATGSATATSPG